MLYLPVSEESLQLDSISSETNESFRLQGPVLGAAWNGLTCEQNRQPRECDLWATGSGLTVCVAERFGVKVVVKKLSPSDFILFLTYGQIQGNFMEDVKKFVFLVI